MGAVKVSVIVPVYNPGSNIDDLLRSLDAQTLPGDEYEAVLVDDGSTDGTGERLDEWAATRPWARIEHIPNSGWPGTPRNIGVGLAQGEFVLFVDNDDWLDPEALQRLWDRATADDADVVVGKVVGHGKLVPRSVFRTDRRDVGVDWEPLLRLLSPHKLFRRALLDEHGIRFPDGRVRLEDHLFCMHAFFHARSISVLADHPIYHWVLRPGQNASRSFDPAGYYRDLRRVLDLIDEHVEPGDLRDRLYSHWYRSKVLKRAGGGNFLSRPEDNQRAMYAEMRDIARERFPARIDGLLWLADRMRSVLLRAGDVEATKRFAQTERRMRSRPSLVDARPDGDDLVVSVRARVGGRFGPLKLRVEGERETWVPPVQLADTLAGQDLDVGRDRERDWLELMIRSIALRTEYTLKVQRGAELEPTDDGLRVPVLTGTVRLSATGERPLADGEWVLGVLPRIAGFTPDAVNLAGPAGTIVFAVRDGRVRVKHPLRHAASRRMPGVFRRARKLRARLRPA